MENETVQYSCPNSESSDVTKERQEVCYSGSNLTKANSPEDMWEGVLGKDYNNIPSTSESPDGPNHTGDDDFQLFITPEKVSTYWYTFLSNLLLK